MKKWVALLVVLAIALISSGCKKGQPQASTSKNETIELVYYRLFDDEEIFAPLIREYEKENPNVKIVYKKFTDPKKYIDLIINELAEGQGPDLFSMQNNWFAEHRKKLNPVDPSLISVTDFENTFVNVAAKDLIMPNAQGQSSIYGLPLYVDTLAIYYNKDQFEDAVPSRGKPASTWSQFQEDVFKLTKQDNSFERFEVAGVAMGRGDNILRAIDILYLLMIQFGAEFYDETYSEAMFSEASGATDIGLDQPGIDAIQFFTQFGLPSNKYYTWNSALASTESDEKEIKTFARGKVSMIFGYSYLYEQIMEQIKELEKKGNKAINANSVKIAPVPQVEDPETSTEKRDSYANYFAETVSRTSKNPEEAWKFLSYLVSKENVQYYHEQTNRPTSRRDMIEEQIQDPTYGVFAEQIGFAESFPMADAESYEAIFKEAIQAILDTKSPKEALQAAQEQVNLLIPEDGLFPVTTPTE